MMDQLRVAACLNMRNQVVANNFHKFQSRLYRKYSIEKTEQRQLTCFLRVQIY